MAYFDEQLQELQRQIARKRHLEAAKAQLDAHRKNLRNRKEQLEGIMNEAQREVERLEGGSLAAFFCKIVGNREEKLAQEREAAYAAKVKYDAAVAELSAVEEDIRKMTEELSTLRGCEERYETLLQEKAAAVKASGSPEGETIFRLEESLTRVASRIKELREAIAAGDTAWDMAHDVLNSLNSAEGWSTFDMLGGGLIADMAKYSRLDNAQLKIEELQYQLTRFRSELADVTLYADIQVNLDGFMRFADYFFDGLFVDWMVRDQIHQSQQSVWYTENQIREVLQRLRVMLNEAEVEEMQTREKRDELILKTKL